MNDAPTPADDDELVDELERKRDSDHLRLLIWLLVVDSPFALSPLFSGAWSGLWRLGTHDVATFLLVARSLVACVAPPIVAWKLANRRGRIACVVLMFLVAWEWPAGTIVGVATMLVLARPSVAELFEEAEDERKSSDPETAKRRTLMRIARRRARRRAAGPPTS
jgi:hypothetical protein